jgi:hypothetical protein
MAKLHLDSYEKHKRQREKKKEMKKMSTRTTWNVKALGNDL